MRSPTDREIHAAHGTRRTPPRSPRLLRRLSLLAGPAALLLLAGCGPAHTSAAPSAALTPATSTTASTTASSAPAQPLATATVTTASPTTTSPSPTSPSPSPTSASPTTHSPSPTPPPTKSVAPTRSATTSSLPGGTPITEPPTSSTGPLAGKVIVVDPGHNGTAAEHLSEINQLVNAGGFMKACQTTGTATNAGYPEHAFNWDTAKRLAVLLRAKGATVVLTRSTDSNWGPCIDQRALLAAHNHATLLISIHGDGAPSTAHGFHVIWPGVVPGYTVATSAPSGRAAVALRNAMVAAGFTPATYINGGTGLNERTDLGTLNRAGTPAVLIECGNMRNPGDAALMSSASGRARIAAGLAAGVVAAVAAIG